MVELALYPFRPSTLIVQTACPHQRSAPRGAQTHRGPCRRRPDRLAPALAQTSPTKWGKRKGITLRSREGAPPQDINSVSSLTL